MGAHGRGAIRSSLGTSVTVPFRVQSPEFWLTALRASGAFAPGAKRPSDLLPPQGPGATPGVRAQRPQERLDWEGKCGGASVPGWGGACCTEARLRKKGVPSNTARPSCAMPQHRGVPAHVALLELAAEGGTGPRRARTGWTASGHRQAVCEGFFRLPWVSLAGEGVFPNTVTVRTQRSSLREREYKRE